MNGMAASDKIFALLDLPEEEGEKKSLAEGEISISLTNVQFSYEKKRKSSKMYLWICLREVFFLLWAYPAVERVPLREF